MVWRPQTFEMLSAMLPRGLLANSVPPPAAKPPLFERTAVWLAAEAGAKTLALFHHDPTRCDDDIDQLLTLATKAGQRCGVRVIAASEGLKISL